MGIRNSWKKTLIKYTSEDLAKTFSKLPAKKPAVSLGLAENYTSSIRKISTNIRRPFGDSPNVTFMYGADSILQNDQHIFCTELMIKGFQTRSNWYA